MTLSCAQHAPAGTGGVKAWKHAAFKWGSSRTRIKQLPENEERQEVLRLRARQEASRSPGARETGARPYKRNGSSPLLVMR
jgi:hypothetical protein